MSFENILEKHSLPFELSAEQENMLVKNISSSFVQYNSDRASNLEKASNLANEIFFKNDFNWNSLYDFYKINNNSNNLMFNNNFFRI